MKVHAQDYKYPTAKDGYKFKSFFKLKFINVADFLKKKIPKQFFRTQFVSLGIQNHLRLVLGFESQIKEITLFFY